MKTIILAFLVSTLSMTAYSASPTKEMADLTRILLNNPTLSPQLNYHCATRLVDYKVSPVKRGVEKFELKFGISGFCIPVEAFVTVIEDMTPTMADGAPEYITTVEIKNRQ